MAITPPNQASSRRPLVTAPIGDSALPANTANQPLAAPPDKHFCPVCQAPCSPLAIICLNCGRALTPPVNPAPVGTASVYRQADNPILGKAFAVHDNTIVTHTIVLFIEGQQLMLPHTSTIILGRDSAADDSLPVVDLTAFDARAKGVSRRHVQLRVAAPLTYVTDLGSTNGTWLNSMRLLASAARVLRSGDELFLGQLKLHVRFQ